MTTSPTIGMFHNFVHNDGYFPDNVNMYDEFQSVRGESDFDDEFHYRTLEEYDINEYDTMYKEVENQNPFKLYNSKLAIIKEDDSEFQYNMQYKLMCALQNYIAPKINEYIYSEKLNETSYYVNSNCSLITFNKDNDNNIIGYFQIDSSITYLNDIIVRYYYVNDAFQLINNDEYYDNCTRIDDDKCDYCDNIKSIPFAPSAYMPYVSIDLEEIKDEEEDEENEDEYSVYELDSVC
jgi:hypothetical protein